MAKKRSEYFFAISNFATTEEIASDLIHDFDIKKYISDGSEPGVKDKWPQLH